MQLLIHITNHEKTVNPIMAELMRQGFHGGSIIDCEGMLEALNQDSVDAPAIIGGLRKFINPDRQNNKLILLVVRDEDVNKAIEVIHGVAGSLKLPNTGILFTVPVTRWEGVSKD